MEKRLLVGILAGLVCAVSAAAGQQKAPAQKPSTITGCVAQSGALYRLDHAIMATDQDVDTQNRPATEASPTPNLISYALVGGDLKGHVGHKVEVTGTVSTAKPSKAAADLKAAPGMTLAGSLNVKSVKMVANTCP